MHLLLLMDLDDRWFKNVEWDGCPRVGEEVCITEGYPPIYSLVEKVSWGFDGYARVVLRSEYVDRLDLLEENSWSKAKPRPLSFPAACPAPEGPCTCTNGIACVNTPVGDW